MYQQFQNQNFQNQFQATNAGGNYITPTERRMYQNAGQTPMLQYGMGTAGNMQNFNQYQQAAPAGTVFNSNNPEGQAANYITPTEQRMYQAANIQPSFNQMTNQGYGQNQTYTQNFGQNYGQTQGYGQSFGQGYGQFQQAAPAGLVYNSNNPEGQPANYITPTEQRMYQSANLQPNFNQMTNQRYGQGQTYTQNFGQNYGLTQGYGQSFGQGYGQFQQAAPAGMVYNSNNPEGQPANYVTPTEQRMYQNTGFNQQYML